MYTTSVVCYCLDLLHVVDVPFAAPVLHASLQAGVQ